MCDSAPTVDTCCCTLNARLYATLAVTGGTACPGLDGQVIPIDFSTFDGTFYIWTGTLTVGCGTFTFNFYFNCATCRPNWELKSGSTICAGGINATPLPCPLTSVVINGSTWSGSCPACCATDTVLNVTIAV